ncbi:MAG: zinc ribbon domain-containing protein [bacterium]|nr:zinc ribbon domain-containing protein [bacterium]
MPVYEYECLDCGRQFEAIQSIKDKPLKTCTFCEGNVHRLISQTSFALKGRGWYQDGYSNPPPKKAPETKKEGDKGTKKEAKASAGKKPAKP